jgi:Ca2+-transporting ATPase
LKTSSDGLTKEEVSKRREKYGFNVIKGKDPKSLWKVFFSQFNDILIFILIFAAFLTLGLAFYERRNENLSIEYFFDTIVIVIVLLINAILGFYQEYKAEKEMASLKSLVSEVSLAFRDGQIQEISSTELVPGDIIELNAGTKIPADVRFLKSNNVLIDEAILTGESVPVSKYSQKIQEQSIALADQKNMAFMGTLQLKGTARAVVVGTGNFTEVGKISELILNIVDSKTPLQIKLEEFSKRLANIILLISLFLVVFGLLVEYFVLGSDEFNLIEVSLGLIIIGVSLAVAAIPEGLPLILTFTLAKSVQLMANQKAIVRKINAVETLGSTTFIATDKTGTLTKNELTLVGIYPFQSKNLLSIDPSLNANQIKKLNNSFLSAITVKHDKEELENISLDPLDKAIMRYKYASILNGEDSEDEAIELPFDSDRKLMSIVIPSTNTSKVFTKGAPDIILNQCSSFYDEAGSIEPMNVGIMSELNTLLLELLNQGYRVIGTAMATLDITDVATIEQMDYNEIEQDLIFTSFLCFIDPPRDEVFETIRKSKTAGIDIAMITGDHPNTAKNIALQLGIIGSNEDRVLTGIEIDNLDDSQLDEAILETRVYARVTPEHKLRLVNLLQQQGQIVAMTGDGVNDSPALIKSDIGVAMGIAGTDASKEAADIILMDDNFTTLVSAIEEGRKLTINIKKFTNYLLASNASEVLLLLFGFIILAIFVPDRLRELIPVTETQILYINLVTDSFLALALGMEKKDRNLMELTPNDPKLPLLQRWEIQKILLILISSTTLVHRLDGQM